LVMKFLAGQDFVGQDQIFDLTISSGGKILRSTWSGFGFFQRVRHEKKLHKRFYANIHRETYLIHFVLSIKPF
jgi:hypothetical protein